MRQTDRQTVRERNTDNLCVRHRYRQKVRQTGNESYSEADRGLQANCTISNTIHGVSNITSVLYCTVQYNVNDVKQQKGKQ